MKINNSCSSEGTERKYNIAFFKQKKYLFVHLFVCSFALYLFDNSKVIFITIYRTTRAGRTFTGNRKTIYIYLIK